VELEPELVPVLVLVELEFPVPELPPSPELDDPPEPLPPAADAVEAEPPPPSADDEEPPEPPLPEGFEPVLPLPEGVPFPEFGPSELSPSSSFPLDATL
jgi:hypothetical protein